MDVGLPINPRGLEAQMQGGIMDGIAQALTSSLHLRNGHFLEGSWDNYWYTRQWNVPPDIKVIVMPPTTTTPGGAGEFGVAATQGRGRVRVRPRHRRDADELPDQPQQAARVRAAADHAVHPAEPDRRAREDLLRSFPCPRTTFTINGEQVSVDCPGDVRMLWVVRDILGITGPKYGCGLDVCKACTSHINGKAFNPCSMRVKDVKPSDEITTIEGLPATVGRDLHPMQEAWLELDVPQCGYCQPGQIMAAVATVKKARAEGHEVTEADLDEIRNICRCGTYHRIREAIDAGAANM